MKKRIFTLIATFAITHSLYAQYGHDGLRFSQTNYGSTARFKALGNAQIGVGGDMSSLGGNPAGLGLFTKSEFSFTPEFNRTGMKGAYLDQQSKTDKSQLNIQQAGVVFFNPVYKQAGQDTKTGLISTVFGLGYNRNNDFGMETTYSGHNRSTSIADYFAQIAGSTSENNLGNTDHLEGWAYNNYLISYDNVANNYYPETFADAQNSNFQHKNEIRSGSVSEFSLSAAANISNQVYIGVNIGLIDLRYQNDASYMESGIAREYLANGNLSGNNINYKLLFNQNQNTTGSGINGRLGVIFRAAEGLRIGATLQTPTWFNIEDSYTEQLDNRETVRGTSNSRTYDYSYNLRTPLKGSLGGSYIIGGTSMLTADLDFIDYSAIRFTSSGGNSTAQEIVQSNQTVQNNFQSAINFRIGYEFKIDALSLRAGYAVNGSPYKDDEDNTFQNQIYSGGLGYRAKNYFVDLTYQRFENTFTFSPYSLSNGANATATMQQGKDNVFLTFGVRF